MSGRVKPRRGTALAAIIWSVAIVAVALAGGAFDARLDSLTFLAPALLLLNTIGLVATLRLPLLHVRLQLSLVVLAECVLLALVLPEMIAMGRRDLAPAHITNNPVSLTVMSVNLWHENEDLTQTLDLIAAEAPDIIVLSEAGEDALNQLSQALSDYPTRVTCATPSYCGVAIYSKLSGRSVAGGAWITSEHDTPKAPPGVLRYAAVELAIPDASDDWMPVVAVHIRRGDSVSPIETQIPALTDVLGTMQRSGPIIVAGDFNTPAWSWAMQRLDSSLKPERVTFNMATWPSGSAGGLVGSLPPILAIDHIYADASWRPTSVRRGPDIGSDHYPVIATLELTTTVAPSSSAGVGASPAL